uniref:Teleost multiple tissue opsin 3b n=1 Tax=Oryzias latipes TaxID=8090 RepID=A0A3P9H0D8_ORYLA
MLVVMRISFLETRPPFRLCAIIHVQTSSSNLSLFFAFPPVKMAAVALGCILVSGFLGNLLVLLVFSRFPGLRTPVSLLLINISVSDMLVCLFGTPLSFAASVRGRWLTGPHGCRWYGFCNALFGVVSLVSLSLLSYERHSALFSSNQSYSSQYRRARLAVAVSWLYSLAWTLPPLLGWSSYGPEGPGTICSVQWQQRSGSARSYVICLFIFCLLLPLLLMFFCYGRILLAVRDVETTNQSPAEWREGRVLLMVTAMVTSYLLCWMPYGVVAIFASFGRPGMVSPAATLVPSLLAKTTFLMCFMNCKKQQSSLSRQSTLDERAADLQRHEPSPQRCTDVDTASLENNSKRVTQTC